MHAPTNCMHKSTPNSFKKQTPNPQELLLEKEVEQPSYRHPSFEPQHIYCHKVNNVFEFTMNKHHTTQSRGGDLITYGTLNPNKASTSEN